MTKNCSIFKNLTSIIFKLYLLKIFFKKLKLLFIFLIIKISIFIKIKSLRQEKLKEKN